jgi:hypothetical protein
MVNNQLKNLYKKNEKSLARRKNTFEKTSLNWVLPGRPGHGSPRVFWVFAHPDILSYLYMSSHRVDRVPVDLPGGSGFNNYACG